MSDAISWLHLTDLHVGQPNGWLWKGMRQQFYEDLRLMADSTGPWDLVLFTGDIAQTGSADEFREAAVELERLWKHFNSLGSNPLLFCVPGNHDVVRPADIDPITRQSLRWHDTSEEAVKLEFWTNKKSQYRKAVERSLKPYAKWLKSVKVPKVKLVEGILPGDFSAVIARNNIHVGLIGLNTTFLQLGKGDYEKKLDIHVQQLHAVCAGEPQNWRDCVDLGILMTHQPPSWLSSEAEAQLSEIYSLGKFDSHLSGHLHNPKMHDISVAGGAVRRLRQGASLFGLEKFGISEVRPLFGYMLGRWEFDGISARELLWPRNAEFTYGGQRRLGPDRGYTLDADNCTITPFDIIRATRDSGCVALVTSLPDEPDIPAEAVAAALALRQRELQSRSIPRWRVPVERQHSAIRQGERNLIVKVLHERHITWLVADWGLGKEGFLASALEAYGGSEPDAFVLRCGEAKTSADIQLLPETQFGLSFQEFFADVRALTLPVLIFDDLPVVFVTGDERTILESEIIQPIRDFCPNLAIIFACRQKPRLTREDEVVTLRALDVHGTREYLGQHPEAEADVLRGGNLEKVHDWAEGLPMRLEYLVSEMRGCSLSDFLDERGEISLEQVAHAEPVPRALRDAVQSISGQLDGQVRRSFRLLKVLSVLRDGEVFHAVKRFYENEPFHFDDVSELIGLELLEAVPIAQTATQLSTGGSRAIRPQTDTPKLLHVPPQVRTYLNGFISKEEREEILATSTELLFGTAWRNGSIRLRKELERSYSETSIGGPGNERFVAQHLVRESLASGDDLRIKRAVQLGLALCRKLLALDWFRDALSATESMVQLLRDTPLREEYAEAARLRANALRMMDEHDAAIEMNNIALAEGSAYFTNDMKGAVFTELALSYKGLDQRENAIEAANKVLTLSGPESEDGFQAQAVIAQVSIDDEDELAARLQELMRNSRRKGHHTTANNIALELVRKGSDPKESLKYLDDVFRTAKGNYTRARAIVNKATLLTSLGRESDLELRDRQLLYAAYDYSYGQRIGKLLGRCHVALWDIFTHEGIWSSLVRLFSLSSFFWRLKGVEGEESKYIRRLDTVDLEELKRVEGRTIESEIRYLERRREDLPRPATDT